MDKLDGYSMDVEQAERDKLAAVFPECFVEGKLLVDKLLALCGEYITADENDRERYEFRWNGKAEALRLAQQRSLGTLRPCKKESVDFDTTKNVYIEGDNLEVLRLLQTSYYRKVKMIYIDPPYNTGNDFVYKDDFKDNIANYKQITSQGTTSNPETAGRYHTNWLNMMYPRLRLAKNLLADDGVIFISIDNNEVFNLKKVCDEVFGEENFVGTIIWKNATDNNPTQIATEHEYIMCYTRRKDKAESVWKSKVSEVKDLLIEIGNKLNAEFSDQEALQNAYTEWYRVNKTQLWPLDRYKYIDKDGVYTGSQSVHNPGREGYRYDIIHPVTGEPCVQPLLGYRFPEVTLQEMISEGKILFGDDHNKIIEIKVYAKDYEEKLSSVFELDGRLGSYDLKSIFGPKPVFSNPKPVQLLQRLLSFVVEENDIILDFFSGSATLGQAVFELNNTDHKKRKFICVQFPENLDKNYETADQKAKAIIKNSIQFLDSIHKPHYITELGKERLRRAGAKLKEEQNGQLKMGEEEKPALDTGFRVFKLDYSNLKIWDNTPVDGGEEAMQRMMGMLEVIRPGRTELDVVYEILLKLGQDLCEDIVPLPINDKTVYAVSQEVLFIVCLAQHITAEDAEAMAEYAPGRIVFADQCFDSVTDASNVKLTLQNRGITIKVL